jgi:CheY-like chemotaxis protein
LRKIRSHSLKPVSIQYLNQERCPMPSGPLKQPRKLRVLVVDDDTDTLQSTAQLAWFWGHEVRTACSGAQALAEAGSFQPDVALLDLAMPGIDGYRLAEQLRAQAGTRPLVLFAVTGMAGKAFRLRCQQSGFTQCLLKPVDPDRLERILRHLAGQQVPAGSFPMPGAEYVRSPSDRACRRRWGMAQLGRRADRVLILRHLARLARKTRRRADQALDRSIVVRSQAVSGLGWAAAAVDRFIVLTDQLAALCRRGEDLLAHSRALLAN